MKPEFFRLHGKWEKFCFRLNKTFHTDFGHFWRTWKQCGNKLMQGNCYSVHKTQRRSPLAPNSGNFQYLCGRLQLLCNPQVFLSQKYPKCQVVGLAAQTVPHRQIKWKSCQHCLRLWFCWIWGCWAICTPPRRTSTMAEGAVMALPIASLLCHQPSPTPYSLRRGAYRGAPDHLKALVLGVEKIPYGS